MSGQSRDRHAELLRHVDRRGPLSRRDNEEPGAEVGEVELEFLGPIARIERRRRRRGPDAEKCRRHLGTVVEHDPDAVADTDAVQGERLADLGN